MMMNRDFISPMARLNIWIIIALLAVDIVWGVLAGFSFDMLSFLTPIIAMTVLFAIGWFYTYHRPDQNIANLMIWTGLLFGTFAAGLVLSYLSTSLNFPLVDKELLVVDRAIGFDWIGLVKFVTSHPYLLVALHLFYALTLPLLALVLVYLALSGKTKVLEVYMTTLLLTAIIVSLLCGILPAIGAFIYLDLSATDFHGFKPVIFVEGMKNYFVHDFEALRDGSLRHISLSSATGIITFPSFHAVLSLVTVLALRGTGWLFIVSVFLFVGTMLSVPVIGGHYLVDVFAGLAITVISWEAAERVQRHLAGKQSDIVGKGRGQVVVA